MLHALDWLNYTTRVEGDRSKDRKSIKLWLDKHSRDVAAMRFAGQSQRMLLARTPLTRTIVANQDKSGVSLTVGKSKMSVVYPAKQAKAAVDEVLNDMSIGEVNLLPIAAEAEDPSWAFAHALGLHEKHPSAFALTGEVLTVVNDVVVVPVYMLKFMLDIDRPVVVNPKIRPWIPTPNHSSFPSGHSTFAHAAAVVLNALTGATDQSLLPQLAGAVARRREIAGLHTSLDSAEGKRLGTAIGEYLVKQATSGTAREWAPWRTLYMMAAYEWTR